MQILIMIALSLMSIFMIVLILVQRGKGGGLAGAFGGMGGQSAFGTKAGDMFTKITVWSAFIWIVLCALTVRHLGNTVDEEKFLGSEGKNKPQASQGLDAPGAGAPGNDETTPGD